MKYMIVAGEASGDLHASRVIHYIKELDPQADFRFLGGDMMTAEAGRIPEIHYREMNVMGFSEVLRHLPRLLGNFRRATRTIDTFQPDVILLVDYPGFNMKLAKYAKRHGISVQYFISPKVWAWKEWRVKTIKKYVDRLYSILPFEIPFFRKHGYNATYVGNPSVDEIDDAIRRLPPMNHFFERQGITDSRPVIALLPGSRKGEIRNNLPLMIEAAKRYPEFQFLIAAAPSVPERFYREVANEQGLNLIFGSTPALLKFAKAALVTSGTATLETALIGTPQVVCYRANGLKLSYKIMEKLLKVKFVSLPNLIVDREIVPELLVHRCTVDNISNALSPLLQPSPQRDSQIGGYRTMRRKLGTADAARQTAEAIVASLKK